MDGGHNIVQEAVTKTIPKKKTCKKPKQLVEAALRIAEERREVKGKGERERYTQPDVEFQRIARREESFLNELCELLITKSAKPAHGHQGEHEGNQLATRQGNTGK